MDDSPDPLTKAMLFSAMVDDDSWTEIGVGVVHVVHTPANEAVYPQMGGGTEGCDDWEPTGARLMMVGIDNPLELLINTPIQREVPYVVQQETILSWRDAEIGCMLSCCFSTKEGCDKIYSEIMDYQRTGGRGAISLMANGASSVGGAGAIPAGGQVGSYVDASGNHIALSGSWLVRRENLPAIASVMQTNPQPFGLFVRSQDTYVKELVELFARCKEEEDQRGLDLIGTIMMSLLRQPFCTDGKIIAQFIDGGVIDGVLHAVQFAIGRYDRKTGFVEGGQRRATFRNPLMLPESMVSKIHDLHACSCLRDMLPVSLDDADANPTSLLSNHLMTSKCSLVEDICKSPSILLEAFTRAYDNDALAFEVTAFLHDMCRTVRNATMPLEYKSSVFEAMIGSSLVPFLRFVSTRALTLYDSVVQQDVGQLPQANVSPGMALLMVCDVVNCCLMFYPQGRCSLLEDGQSRPDGCLLESLLRFLVTSCDRSELQATVDAVMSCVTCVFQHAPASITIGIGNPRGVIQFWLGGSDGKQRAPLLSLAEGLASTLCSVTGVVRGLQGEMRALHILKVFTVLTNAVDEQLSQSLASVLEQSGVLQCMSAALLSHARLVANVQSSIASFVGSLLSCGKQQLVSLPLLHAGGELLDAAVRRYLACGPSNNTVLQSSLAHLIDCMRRAVLSERRCVAGYTSLHTSGNGAVARTPSLVRGGNDTSSIADGDGGEGDEDSGNTNICQNVVNRLWRLYGERLRRCSPALARRLELSLKGSLEEAGSVGADTSSVASTADRFLWGGRDADFEALMAELSEVSSVADRAQPGSGEVFGGDDASVQEGAVWMGSNGMTSAECASRGDGEECDDDEYSSDGPPSKRSRSESSSATAME